MKVYIAGPMSGRPNRNREAYDRAAARWREAGHTAINPFEIGAADPALTWEAALRVGMRALLDAEAMALLPGWERSRGAALELAVAIALDLPLFDAETRQPLTTLAATWSVEERSAAGGVTRYGEFGVEQSPC